jgi:hypothetical protein
MMVRIFQTLVILALAVLLLYRMSLQEGAGAATAAPGVEMQEGKAFGTGN